MSPTTIGKYELEKTILNNSRQSDFSHSLACGGGSKGRS